MTDAKVGAWLTSAQVDGVAPTADWARWIDRSKAPHSGSGHGLDPDDLAMFATYGVTELVVTAEWSRLRPGPRETNHLEIERFRQLVESVAGHGIAPWICLVDGTLPGWFVDDEGGFDDRRGRELLWPAYVDFVGELVGDLAAGWIPQREPIRRVMRSGILSVAPPGKRGGKQGTTDSAAVNEAVTNVMLAEAAAWRLLQGTSPVAASITGRTFFHDTDDVRARPQAEWLDELAWRAFERVLVDGNLTVAGRPTTSVDEFRDAYDAIVVHPRPPIVVDGEGGWAPLDGDRFEPMAEAVDRASQLAGTRRLIACGDLATATSSDDEQERSDHMQAMIESSGSAGAQTWWQSSPIDTWNWERGVGTPNHPIANGVFARDRTPRRAAELLQRLASS